jgi:PAS domain S-box-containing protein
MKKQAKVNKRKKIFFRVVLFAGIIILFGMLFTAWIVKKTDIRMREKLLNQVTLIADSLNSERVARLSGDKSDLNDAIYFRLKKQFAAIKAADPLYKFVYLMGRRADGELFTFVDNENSDSPNYSPPGELYEEATEGERSVFRTGVGRVEGPFTNRWGNFVSALVPLFDPSYIVPGSAISADAKNLLLEAETFYRQHGRARFLEEVGKGDGLFCRGDLYAFVYDLDMTFLAHPVRPEYIGKNLINEKDWVGGTYFRKEIQNSAISKGGGSVHYEYENPLNHKIEPKTTFVKRLDDMILCAGAYKGSGPVVAVFGVDIDVRDWRSRLIAAAFTPLFFTFIFLVFLFLSVLLFRIREQKDTPPRWMRDLELICIFLVGILLSSTVAWIVYNEERSNRDKIFESLATSRTETLVKKMSDLRNIEIEGLVRFFENSDDVSLDEYRAYTAFLTNNPTVRAWVWVPRVFNHSKDQFETRARSFGMQNYEIWEKNEYGERVRASLRDVHYPSLYIVPEIETNKETLGFDYVSDPLRWLALKEARLTGLTTATKPIVFIEEGDRAQGIRIVKPVLSRNDKDQIDGFIVAVLRVETLISDMYDNDTTKIGLSFLSRVLPPEVLAADWTDEEATSDLSFTRLIPIFGKVFAVTVKASDRFLNLYRLKAGWYTLVLGLSISITLVFILFLTFRRREELERIVHARTREIEEALVNMARAEQEAIDAGERFKTLFHYNSDALMILTDEGFIDCNLTALKTFGCRSKEAFCHLHPADVSPEFQADGVSSRELSEKKLAAAFENGTGYFEWIHKRLDTGETFPAEVFLTVIELDGQKVLHASVRNIAKRIQAEKEREKAYAEIRKNELIAWSMMEDANIARKEAEELKKQADAASLAKSQFLANMSHEIRTPMNGIIGFAALLENMDLTEQQREYVKIICSSGTHLLGIIDDILDISKFDAGKLKLESIEFNLDYLCHDVLKMLLPKIQDSNIRTYVDISADVPCDLKGDPTRMRQVLVNLLGNAVKFTTEGEIGIHIRRDLSVAQEGYASLRISVKDTGIGIDKEKQKDLFNAFTQADESTTRRYGGTGLGLTICKAIVEAMGGTLWVESEKGKGSEFILTIPFLLSKRAETEGIVPLRRKALMGKRVIIVDDNEENITLMKEFCESVGLCVSATFLGSKTALSALLDSKETADILLIDIMMPGGSGLDMAKKIRSAQNLRSIKMIAITSDVRIGTARGAHEYGFDGYLPKPISKDELLNVIVTVLGDLRTEGPVVTRHLAEELQCKGVRILVAEDNVINCALLREFFTMLGSSADFTHDGAHAIQKLRESTYDLCLMDINMPVMSGLEATRVIRAEISKDFPVIALSAAVLAEDKEKAYEAGMSDYLMKPITFESVKNIILKWKDYAGR